MNTLDRTAIHQTKRCKSRELTASQISSLHDEKIDQFIAKLDYLKFLRAKKHENFDNNTCLNSIIHV